MSKIGKTPIEIKEGTTVTVVGNDITVVGSKGTLSFKKPEFLEVKVEGGLTTVLQKKGEDNKAMYGLTRALLANMIKGVENGFEKKLELTGVGYRAQALGSDLTLSVGFSHPVKIKAPQGVTFEVLENVITVSGIDKKLVGDMAAKVRAIRPPEPYKGKGIKYVGERIRRKAGKAAKAVGAK